MRRYQSDRRLDTSPQQVEGQLPVSTGPCDNKCVLAAVCVWGPLDDITQADAPRGQATPHGMDRLLGGGVHSSLQPLAAIGQWLAPVLFQHGGG